jgi:SAM-dependent methyltransferase
MRPNEAKLIGNLMGRFDTNAISPCLNLGSSTGTFRTEEQRHIDQHIFAPLRERGVRVVHVDIKEAAGVDLAGNIYDAATMEAILALSPRCVLCCNMFEHVTDRQALAARISHMLAPDGLLVVTVPYSYPIHYDPIDTYFRPSPDEIVGMFPDFQVLKEGVVSDSTYFQDLLRTEGIGGTLVQFTKSAVKLFMIWRGLRFWKGHFHRYLWLFRPYQVSWVLMRKF